MHRLTSALSARCSSRVFSPENLLWGLARWTSKMVSGTWFTPLEQISVMLCGCVSLGISGRNIDEYLKRSTTPFACKVAVGMTGTNSANFFGCLVLLGGILCAKQCLAHDLIYRYWLELPLPRRNTASCSRPYKKRSLKSRGVVVGTQTERTSWSRA